MSTSTVVEEEHSPWRTLGPLLVSLLLFAGWTFGTWVMEGRLGIFSRPDAQVARLAYAVIVNLIVGVGGSAWLVRRWMAEGLVNRADSGFVLRWRTPVAIALGLALGAGAYATQGAPTWDPMVLTNAFCQVLVVSTAEVMVCWVLIGNLVRTSLHDQVYYVAPIVAALVASVLFGLYHFAHSPPFNTWSMVSLLMVIGLLTSAFYFIARDVWGTIAFHNMFAVFGVTTALADQDALASFAQPVPSLIGTAVATIIVLVVVQVWLGRTKADAV